MSKVHSNSNSHHQSEPSSISGARAKEIGMEYGDLMVASDLSQAQEERIIQILELALTNKEVEFWVSHLTCIRGMEAGLLTETAQKEYEDQKALLKEHLGNPDLPPIRGLAAQNITARLREQMEQQVLDKLVAATKGAGKHGDSPHQK